MLSCIKKGEIPGELCCFESIDSTNEEAKRRGEAGAPDGSIYVADNQTNGKGRRGRTWLSPSGEDILQNCSRRDYAAWEHLCSM